MNDGGFEAWLDENNPNEKLHPAWEGNEYIMWRAGAEAAWAKAQDELKSKHMEIERLKNRDMDCTEALFRERIVQSQADKLAETLEYLITAPDHQCFSEAKLRAAKVLKEYRNEK